MFITNVQKKQDGFHSIVFCVGITDEKFDRNALPSLQNVQITQNTLGQRINCFHILPANRGVGWAPAYTSYFRSFYHQVTCRSPPTWNRVDVSTAKERRRTRNLNTGDKDSVNERTVI